MWRERYKKFIEFNYANIKAFSTTYEPKRMFYKIVETVSDLPDADENNIITLEDYTTYFLVSNLDLLGKRIITGFISAIIGTNSETCTLTSTGLGVGVPLITSKSSLPIRHITIKDVDTALDIDGTLFSSLALDWTGFNLLNVPNIGTIKNIGNFIFSKGALLNSKNLIFDGTSGTIGIDNSLLQGDGQLGSIIKILPTVSINRRLRVDRSAVIAFGDTVGIDFDNSAFVDIESYILDTVNFSGGGTYLSGYNTNDNEALFKNCKGIINTAEISQFYMHDNLINTVIVATNTPTKVQGNSISSTVTQKFVNTNNRATCKAALPRYYEVTITLTVESGNNNQIGAYIAKNGTVLNESKVYTTTNGSGRAENITIQSLVLMGFDDYIEPFVENGTTVNNILVTDLNAILK